MEKQAKPQNEFPPKKKKKTENFFHSTNSSKRVVKVDNSQLSFLNEQSMLMMNCEMTEKRTRNNQQKNNIKIFTLQKGL
jgi:hypothetical protein